MYCVVLQLDREKIPERTVHARGMVAKGYFEVSMADAMAAAAAATGLRWQPAPNATLLSFRGFTFTCLPKRHPACHSWLLPLQQCHSRWFCNESPIVAVCIVVAQVTHDVTDICRANLMSSVGKKTPVAARFSTVVHPSGSPESLRDVRGFAVKFYSQEGNWDLVGNSIPVSGC